MATTRHALANASPPAPLVLDAASRRYGPTLALAPLSLRLEAGTLCVVAGPNGSGKTTLLRLAAGLLAPSTGERAAAGGALFLRPGDGARDVERVERAVGFAAGLGAGDADEALRRTGLRALARRRAGTLSTGQRARLTLAVALAVAPPLVCLDEPTAHLDEAGVATALEILDVLTGRGSAVLVATHERQRLGPHADAVVELRDGRLEAAR